MPKALVIIKTILAVIIFLYAIFMVAVCSIGFIFNRFNWDDPDLPLFLMRGLICLLILVYFRISLSSYIESNEDSSRKDDDINRLSKRVDNKTITLNKILTVLDTYCTSATLSAEDALNQIEDIIKESSGGGYYE